MSGYLYCIGGALDGKTAPLFKGDYFEHLTYPAGRRCQRQLYECRSFLPSDGEPMVQFWCFTEMSTLAVELQAQARYADAVKLDMSERWHYEQALEENE